MLELTDLKPSIKLNKKQTEEVIGGGFGALGGSVAGSLSALAAGSSSRGILLSSGIGALGGAIAGIPGGPLGASLS
ncbi:MAG: hypothetical protein AAF383_15310 [Cyanobacteria bacterium P01_A01_bin.83]